MKMKRQRVHMGIPALCGCGILPLDEYGGAMGWVWATNGVEKIKTSIRDSSAMQAMHEHYRSKSKRIKSQLRQ
jgi:hypothetical protein